MASSSSSSSASTAAFVEMGDQICGEWLTDVGKPAGDIRRDVGTYYMKYEGWEDEYKLGLVRQNDENQTVTFKFFDPAHQ